MSVNESNFGVQDLIANLSDSDSNFVRFDVSGFQSVPKNIGHIGGGF
jgi:hypothetical protein